MNKTFIGIVLVLLVGVGAYLWLGPGASSVPVKAEYDDKIVYDTETSKDPEPYKKDCERRGGSFNPCGSPCASDAEVCIQVCAFTCDLSEKTGE